MLEKRDKGKKVLVTMIGANPAIDTEYAFFEDDGGKEKKSSYRKKEDKPDHKNEKYGYPFWAKIKSMTREECFDQIVFIGTEASKWESLISNAEKLSMKPVDDKKYENGKSTSEDELEQMNQYLNQLIGEGYNSVTEKEFKIIQNYVRNLLTPEEKRRVKENAELQKHKNYIQQNLSENELHVYESQLSQYITLAVRGSDDPDISPIEVKVVLIREGRTDRENRENIITIQKELSSIPISEITLDVTNGLRSHPMYVLSIINNLSALRNKGIPVNIYYGMFDAKLKKENETQTYMVPANPREGEVAPMVDLREIQIMDKWTRAISEFFSNGSVLQILELLDEMKNAQAGQLEIEDYITAFESFSLAVNSNNLLLFENAIKKIESLRETIHKTGKMPDFIQTCLEQIISHIWNQFKIEEAEEKTRYSFYMFALANWYLQQNRLGDSVRTFQEAVITYLMEKYPEKISRLLENKMVQWSSKQKQISDVMFDGGVRKVIREAVFEEDFIIEGREEEYEEWLEWTKEYHYMKECIHDPDALLYNLEQTSEDQAAVTAAQDGHGMRYAREIIEKFAKKMPKQSKQDQENLPTIVGIQMFKKRLNYLLDIRYYDVFISYRRSYHTDEGHALNDGVLLVTALSDYLKKKGLRVFVDKNKMRGVQGEFTNYLQQNLRNSKLCLVVLGKDAYARDYADTDEYYKEIKTAVQSGMKIAVICMEDFYNDGKSEVNFGNNVSGQSELMKVINSLQRVGSEYSDLWKYENVFSLRKCAYKEIRKMLEE